MPFLIYAEESQRGTLRVHSRAPIRSGANWPRSSNAWSCSRDRSSTSPRRGIRPSTKPAMVVPTWNYVTVHAWGRPRVIDDAAWLRRQIDDLTLLKEGALPAPWKVDDAPAQYVASQMKGIVGVEIPIDRIEGKWKVSQNRPAGRPAPASSPLARRRRTAESWHRWWSSGCGRSSGTLSAETCPGFDLAARPACSDKMTSEHRTLRKVPFRWNVLFRRLLVLTWRHHGRSIACVLRAAETTAPTNE